MLHEVACTREIPAVLTVAFDVRGATRLKSTTWRRIACPS
jgi:hypothetical protein